MALVGYDNSKNAFRVRNSWGTSWGDNGSIWVDYDFFCKSFCFAAFVAQNPVKTLGSGGVTGVTGTDLLAYYVEDYPCLEEGFTRTFTYDVYNSGTTTIYPSEKWTVAYMYYNAKDAREYEIIYVDYFTDEYGKEGDFDYWDDAVDYALVGGYWNNFTVRPGENVGADGDGYNYIISYNMPTTKPNGQPLTGDYYLVLMAEAYDVIREVNEDNNFYFITAENGKPLRFVNGVVQNMPQRKSAIQRNSVEKRPAPFSNTDKQTAVTSENPNTYTPAELKAMLLHDKKTGKLDAKLKVFSNGNESKNFVKRVKVSEK